MFVLKELISETVIKEIIKDFFKVLPPSGLIALSSKVISNISWTDVLILLIIAIVVISTFILVNKYKDTELLNTYKVLNRSNNFRISYGEKWLLDILIESGRDKFLRTEDFASLINSDVEYIEKNYDPDDEVWAMIYSVQKKFTQKEYVDKVLNNLIAYGFVQEVNKKGLLKINSIIFKYKRREKEIFERNKVKESVRRYKIQKKKDRQKSIKNNIVLMTTKINNLFFNKLKLSSISKSWILDIDGTIVKHNGYKTDGHDTLLPGVKEFFEGLSLDDKVILLTARKEECLPALKDFLKENNIHYDYLLFDMPMGERILVNDRKPSGLDMAFAINKDRDKTLNIAYKINEEL